MSVGIDLGIIIPIKDEEENIAELGSEIGAVMQNLPWSWECIWVDDGSTDNSASELRKISETSLNHRFLSLTKNFGQSAALYAGMSHSRGRYLATLDGDGQNDPKDIPRLFHVLLEKNLDMVSGVRLKRRDSFKRRLSSRIANSFRNWITKEEVTDVGCSVRVFRRECVASIPIFKGMHRFLPTLVRIGGHERITEIPVHHRPRKKGATKYGITNRLWVGIVDTLAVKWMRERLVYPKVKFSSRDWNERMEE